MSNQSISQENLKSESEVNQSTSQENIESQPEANESSTNEPKPSYVKLAMRNMVKKKGISLKHFFLTTVGLLGFLIGISYLTR